MKAPPLPANDSSAIVIRPVQGRADLETFIRLPWSLQGRDPCWVPPFLAQQRHFLSPRTGPFFEHGEAVLFLACRNGRPVGRLSAHDNHAYEQHHDARTALLLRHLLRLQRYLVHGQRRHARKQQAHHHDELFQLDPL